MALNYLFPECKFHHVDENDCFTQDNICQLANIDNITIGNSIGGFNILGVNIRSISFNFPQFQVFLECLPVKIHIITVVETWLTKETDNGFNLPGFKAFNIYRNTHGGGIKIYARNDLQSNIIQSLTHINEFYESVFLGIEASDGSRLRLGCVYRSPSLSLVNFTDTFLTLV